MRGRCHTYGLFVLLLSWACGVATANADDPYDDGSGPCVQKTRVVGDGFETPWGITPRDVQKAALGKHRTPITWRREEAMSYGVEGTRTTLVVEITRGTGPIEFVERNGSQRADDMVAYDCGSELSVPVHVKATTQDGVVSIEGDSKLVVSSRNQIAVTLYGKQQGTLRIRKLEEEGTVVDSFGIALAFRPNRTMVGAIGGGYRCGDFNCMHLPYAYACFPEKPPFGLDAFMFGACSQ